MSKDTSEPHSWTSDGKPIVPQEPSENPAMGRLSEASKQENVTKQGSTDALSVQVGGDHYKKLAIQPVEYIMANNLSWCEGNIVKYATRHKAKGGSQDLRKVIHYAQLELKQTYGEDI